MTQPPEQPILVLFRKKPHLIFLLVASVVSGLLVFAGGSTEADLPTWLVRAWSGVELMSGGIALIAHLQRWDRERGMRVERGSLTIQAAAVIAYGMALPVYLGWPVDVIAALIVASAWAGANLWEVRLIGADLKLIAAVRSLTPGSVNASAE